MHAPLPIAYKAFLSYSHADTASAKWLHKRLESFPLSGLSGRETALGPVPKSLRPIFRDREDFSAGHSLTGQTIASLDASAALIVLSSPASASSHYVNEEIRLFKSRHPGRPVIPLIADGKPGGAAECFAPALRFELDADGSVTDRPSHILAADIREEGDGRELALAKVVAALIGVPSDEVFRRAERERRRQTRLRAAIAATILMLAGAGGYLGWRSYTQQQTLTDIEALVNQYAPIGSAEAAQPGARERLRTAFESIAKGTATDPRYARALDLIKAGKPQEAEPLLKAAAEEEEAAGLQRIKQAAEKYRNLGAIAGYADLKRAREYYAKAVKLDPENVEAMLWHGEMEKEARNLGEAERAYNAVLRSGAQGRDESNFYWAKLGLGDILIERGDPTAALRAYREASLDADHLAKADPNNGGWQRDLSVSYNKVGKALALGGALPDALKSYRDSLAIIEHLAETDPSNTGWQMDLLVANSSVGDVLRAQGAWPDALKAYLDSLAIAERLAKANPGNADWQNLLSISHIMVGHVLAAQGALPDALKAYRDSLAIMERLAKANPGNADLQRGLSVSYIKVGDVLKAQGALPDALKAYRDSLTIMERLAKADPSNAGWQHDLTFSYERVGDVLTAQGALDDALNAYRDSLAIKERLASADPSNARLQRDLAGSYSKTGEYAKASATQAALVAITERSEESPGAATAAELLSLSWYRLFARDFNGALEASDHAIAIEPENIIHATNKAHALMFLGRADEARALYLRYKGRSVDESGKLWEAAILEDFQEFETRGLTHPQMAEIKALFAPAAPGR